MKRRFFTMDPITDYILSEGYVFDDKTISSNLYEFESKKKSKLIIVGVMGSGKSTLRKHLAKKYNVKAVASDGIWYKKYLKHFKGQKPTPENKKALREMVADELIKLLKNNERMILDGVDFIELYRDIPKYRKLILSYPMILLGLSSFRAGMRGAIRNRKREDEGWKTYYWMIKRDMKEFEPTLKVMRKHARMLPNVNIEEFEIPKNIRLL